MATEIRAQCSFQGASGLPEDVYVNDVSFDTGVIPFTGTHADAFTAAWANFFNDGAHKVADYMSDQVDRSADACTIAFYDNTAIGSPLAVRSWTLAAIGAVQSLPHEVCAVLSIHADLTNVPETAPNPTPPPATIRPAARRRGRLYIGPLNVGAVSDAGGDARLSSAFITVLKDAAIEFSADLNTASMDWVVWSKTNDFSAIVTGGFIDNAFDTQRRRGSESTSRTTFAL